MKTQQWLQKYPLITMVAAYIIVTLLAGPKLADSLGADVMWTCLAAAATLICILLLAPDSLHWQGLRETVREPWVRHALFWVGAAALLGLVANAAALALGIGGLGDGTASDGESLAASANATWEAAGGADAGGTISSGPIVQPVSGENTAPGQLPFYARILLLIGCCFSTAVFEEGFFRGIVVPCALRRTEMEVKALQAGDVGPVMQETYSQMTPEEQREATNIPYSAAVFSGLLFGVVHIMSGTPDFGGATFANVVLMVAEGLGKAVQAGMFGYVMAALMLRSGSVFGPMVVHCLFDLLYFAPTVLATGALPTAYITGTSANLLLLAITIAALIPAVHASSSWLKGAAPNPAADA